MTMAQMTNIHTTEIWAESRVRQNMPRHDSHAEENLY